MRSRTIRFAAAASDARRTVIPFASRAAMVLFTRTSLARVPQRRVSDPSGSISTSLIIRNLLPAIDILAITTILLADDCICKYLPNQTPLLISIGSWRRRYRAAAAYGPGTRYSGLTPRFYAS